MNYSYCAERAIGNGMANAPQQGLLYPGTTVRVDHDHIYVVCHRIPFYTLANVISGNRRYTLELESDQIPGVRYDHLFIVNDNYRGVRIERPGQLTIKLSSPNSAV